MDLTLRTYDPLQSLAHGTLAVVLDNLDYALRRCPPGVTRLVLDESMGSVEDVEIFAAYVRDIYGTLPVVHASQTLEEEPDRT